MDYMGDSFKKHIAANIDQKIVHQARQFAVGQLAHFEKIEDEKLRGRYERLVAYFDSRAHVWL